jgi:hypothetical protein
MSFKNVPCKFRMNSHGQVEKLGICHINKLMKVIFLISWLLVLGGNALAQLSDLRYSRKPLPGVSDISEVGIVVDMGLAQDLMQPAAIVETLRPRLENLGYRVALGSTHSPDGLWVQVDCQDLPQKIDSRSSRASQQPSGKVQRLGPPCHLAYGYQHEMIPWKNVDRLIYSESVATMQQISQITTPLKPQECVQEFFRLYDFPVLLAAEWGHGDLLLHVLNRPDTPVSRQRLILILLGETHVARGYSILVEKLQDGRVAKEAAEALGFFGLQAQKHLLPILKDRSNPQLQEAAAKGLGRIAAATGNSQQTPLYMKMVADSTIDIRVRTQLVWALGKAPDMRAFPTLMQLEQQIWTNYSRDPHLQTFREAVDWSIREVKQGGHGDDF